MTFGHGTIVGQNENENQKKNNHKKGHVIKGFKKSHHKDESGNTEEYYDEAHDSADDFNRNGKSGNFAEDAASSYKGVKDNKLYKSDEKEQGGAYDSGEFLKKNNGGKSTYGGGKHVGNTEIAGNNYGEDEQSLLGHQEYKKVFHEPHVPFYQHI